MGMQTLTLGIATVNSAGARRHLLGYAPRNFTPAANGLKTPVVTPFAEPAAWVDPHRFRPGMDRAKAGLSIEIKDHIGVRNVDLTFQNNPVRLHQKPRALQRVNRPSDKSGLIKGLSSRIRDFT